METQTDQSADNTAQHGTESGALRAEIERLRARLDEHEGRDGAAHRKIVDDARAELDDLLLALDDDYQERAERRRASEQARALQDNLSSPDAGGDGAADSPSVGEGTQFDRPPVDGKRERRKAGTFW